MACEATRKNGTECANTARFIVNGRLREVQAVACGVHLPQVVAELSFFDDPRYKLRHPNDKGAATVYVIPSREEQS